MIVITKKGQKKYLNLYCETGNAKYLELYEDGWTVVKNENGLKHVMRRIA